jgi:hypothetical protein
MRMYPRNISEEEPIELKPLVNSWGWGKGESLFCLLRTWLFPHVKNECF